MKKFIGELFERLKSETPYFFVKLKYLAGSLILAGGSLQTIPHAPERLIDIGVNLIIAGGVMAAVSQLTVKAPDQK